MGFSFSTNTEWVILLSESWCRYEASTSGEEVSVVLTCGANNEYEPRECQITIRAAEIEKKVKVVQAQKDAINIDKKDKYDASPDGETLVVKLSHNIDCLISINVPWIEKVGTKAYETESVTFAIDHNYTDADRQGEIRFASQDNAVTKVICKPPIKHVY